MFSFKGFIDIVNIANKETKKPMPEPYFSVANLSRLLFNVF